MSNNDGSGPKGSGKPGDSTSQGKKPAAIIDLKATEVQGSKSDDSGAGKDDAGKSASNLKGAPGWQPDKSGGKTQDQMKGLPTKDGKESDQSSKSSGVPPVSARSTDTKSQDKDQKGAKADVKSAASSGTVTSASSKGDTGSTSAKSGETASKSGDTTSKSGGDRKDPPAASAAPPPAPAKSGGGGFFSTLTHMAAGVIGGGIALFAVEPIEQQFAVKLRPDPTVPAAFEQRVAALETSRPASADGVASAQDVTALAEKLAAAENRIAALDGLGAKVAALASDVEKATAAASSSTEGGNQSEGGTGAEVSAALRSRLAKIESTLGTLASATTGDGRPNAMAPIASLSGKLADVETSLNSQIASLRERLLKEMDQRVAGAAEASASASAGTKRLDREVADLKTDNARLVQRAENLQAASEKLNNTMRAVQEQAANLKVALDGLKGDVNQQFTKVARPDDVSKAIQPVAAKVASIEKNLNSVVASESARKANAGRIVLSLELANLKRVLDRGAPFAAELAGVQKVAGSQIDLAALEPYKDKGVPSGRDLTRQFQGIAHTIINAESQPSPDTPWVERLLAGAQSIVKVRRTDLPANANTTEASVARIEKLLKDGNLSGALSLAEKLPEKSKDVAKGWMSQLSARAEVDRAISKIEGQLKSALGGG